MINKNNNDSAAKSELSKHFDALAARGSGPATEDELAKGWGSMITGYEVPISKIPALQSRAPEPTKSKEVPASNNLLKYIQKYGLPVGVLGLGLGGGISLAHYMSKKKKKTEDSV